MTDDEINFQKSERKSLLFEVSDEALEACGGLGASPTPAYASYCFTCPHLNSAMALDVPN
jgi:hypothetical protein